MMNRNFRFMSVLAMFAMVSFIISCDKENNSNQDVIEHELIGKWEVVSINGAVCPTNMRSVYTFKTDGTGTTSTSSEHGPKNKFIWNNKRAVSYTISGNELRVSQTSRTSYYKITDIDKTSLAMHFFMMERNDSVIVPNSMLVYKRVSDDFSNDIVGLWEGVAMTGEETYGNMDARIEFDADGTYTYYRKSGENWVKSANVDNEYNVDGNWLATRWRPFEGQDFNYEWWDIDTISKTRMEWSALRERSDGSLYTTTFTWKKIY